MARAPTLAGPEYWKRLLSVPEKRGRDVAAAHLCAVLIGTWRRIVKRPDILRRLSSIGITVPLIGGGFSATLTPASEAETPRAARVLTFLEDRRVLFDPMDVEIAEYAGRSVMEIRQHLAQELMQIERASVLAASLRGMTGACHQFLSRTQWDPSDVSPYPRRRSGPPWADQVFHQALGELRGHFSVHIAQMAAAHGLDVEGRLATILPDVGEE